MAISTAIFIFNARYFFPITEKLEKCPSWDLSIPLPQTQFVIVAFAHAGPPEKYLSTAYIYDALSELKSLALRASI